VASALGNACHIGVACERQLPQRRFPSDCPFPRRCEPAYPSMRLLRRLLPTPPFPSQTCIGVAMNDSKSQPARHTPSLSQQRTPACTAPVSRSTHLFVQEQSILFAINLGGISCGAAVAVAGRETDSGGKAGRDSRVTHERQGRGGRMRVRGEGLCPQCSCRKP
jgi:hypothetical protein